MNSLVRQALLIAESTEADPIPGVYTDVTSWLNFLRSNAGGVWREQEINIARDWGREKLLSAVNAMKNADYSLIVFAGHGQIVRGELPWDETQVFLSDSTWVTERELNPGTARCTLILDTCRRVPVKEEHRVLIEKKASLEDKVDAVMCRAQYDRALSDAEGGLVTIYSTEIGYSAADSPSFSQFFINNANEWAKKHRGVLSLQAATHLVAEKIAKYHPQQRPEYNGGRRLRHFPFAVNF